MSTQMTIELSAEKPRKHEFYRATLDLPATELQIEDALSRARFQNESSQKFIDIEEAVMFDPSHLSVTADDIHALNYLAKRLDSLSEEDEIKFEALYYARTRGMQEDEQIHVGSVINMTYGLDMIPLAVNVGTDYELGRFVVENDFDERFEKFRMPPCPILITNPSERNSENATTAYFMANTTFPQGTMN